MGIYDRDYMKAPRSGQPDAEQSTWREDRTGAGQERHAETLRRFLTGFAITAAVILLIAVAVIAGR